MVTGCNTGKDGGMVITSMLTALDQGNLSMIRKLADSVKRSDMADPAVLRAADSISQIAERIAIDFSLSDQQVIRQIEKRTGVFSEDDKQLWEENGWLESRMIDGEKKFFRRSVSNLFLLKKFYEEKDLWRKETAEDPEMIFRLKHALEVMKYTHGNPAAPADATITYTITVHPDVVPEGEMIRCWMPWPKSNHPRQKNIELLGTSSMEYIISPDTSIHSTLYMEQRAKKGAPAIFRISFRYQSSAQYFDLSKIKIIPYNKESEVFRKYTAEQPPHIIFSEHVKQMADSITGDEKNPSEIVRKIYYWFKENIPWTGALEYSIMPDIPEYVLKNRRGDCGMQTFLFISMLRYKEIPVRWQSGWMIPPGAENLHDWCEIYFEDAGWIPSDVSYDLLQSEIKEVREFYLSGIDSYRLILNDGAAGNLYPEKKFLRSEPYDFQRGEVEYEGGNLYFDKWDYDVQIDFLK